MRLMIGRHTAALVTTLVLSFGLVSCGFTGADELSGLRIEFTAEASLEAAWSPGKDSLRVYVDVDGGEAGSQRVAQEVTGDSTFSGSIRIDRGRGTEAVVGAAVPTGPSGRAGPESVYLEVNWEGNRETTTDPLPSVIVPLNE